MIGDMITAGHLGGYVEGGDDATWYPDLWQGFINNLDVESVVDIGCGEGLSTRWFADHGCKAVGIEGLYQPQPASQALLIHHDYTLGPRPMLTKYDLAWCCEFVEHVEERYIPNFLVTMQSATIVAMTHAEPGQAGHHHVNCRPTDYWIGVMAGAGYALDIDLTNWARRLAGKNENPWNHFKRSGLVFVKGAL